MRAEIGFHSVVRRPLSLLHQLHQLHRHRPAHCTLIYHEIEYGILTKLNDTQDMDGGVCAICMANW